jgi:hypothetical protein
MSFQMQMGNGPEASFMSGYLEALALVERLHRLLLDVIKDEFERVGDQRCAGTLAFQYW